MHPSYVPVPQSSTSAPATVDPVEPRGLGRSVLSPPPVHLVAAVVDVQLDDAVLLRGRFRQRAAVRLGTVS